MGIANQGNSPESCETPHSLRGDWNYVRLAPPREHTQGYRGIGIKMKVYLVCTSLLVFSFSTVAGANLRTVAELHRQNGIIAAQLISMTLKQLGEQNI